MLSYALLIAQLQAVMHTIQYEQICKCCLDVILQLVLGCALSTIRSMPYPKALAQSVRPHPHPQIPPQF